MACGNARNDQEEGHISDGMTCCTQAQRHPSPSGTLADRDTGPPENGIESFGALLKRGYVGTHHWMSSKHPGRYVTEFAGRFNDRQADTIKQMAAMARKMNGRTLPYESLARGA